MFRKLGYFLGRLFIGIIFLISALHIIGDWQSTETELIHSLFRWNGHAKELPSWLDIFQPALNYAPFLLVMATLLLLLGSISLLFSIKPRLGAFLLLLFLLPTTLVFHPFWFFDGKERDLQEVMFLKNLAILGGLFLLLSFEKPGKKSTTLKNADLSEEE